MTNISLKGDDVNARRRRPLSSEWWVGNVSAQVMGSTRPSGPVARPMHANTTQSLPREQ